jgi:hypothetical protein
MFGVAALLIRRRRRRDISIEDNGQRSSRQGQLVFDRLYKHHRTRLRCAQRRLLRLCKLTFGITWCRFLRLSGFTFGTTLGIL